MIITLLIFLVIALTVGSMAYTLHNSYVILDNIQSDKVLGYTIKAVICQMAVMAIAILALAFQ